MYFLIKTTIKRKLLEINQSYKDNFTITLKMNKNFVYCIVNRKFNKII